MRVVLDTNVVVSALLWGGQPKALLRAATDDDLLLCTSPALLDELRDVLARPHLASRLEQFHPSLDRAMTLYAGLCLTVFPTSLPGAVAADQDDDHVVAAAIEGRADLIVSGDRHLLDLGRYEDIHIVTPAEAVRLLAEVRP